MNILKIVNGKIEVRKDNGSLIRTFSVTSGDTAVNADFNGNQSLIAITTAKGKVELRKENGSLVRYITVTSGSTAVNVRWNGSDLAITTNKGKTEIQLQFPRRGRQNHQNRRNRIRQGRRNFQIRRAPRRQV